VVGKRDPARWGSCKADGAAQVGAVLARKVPTLKAIPTAVAVPEDCKKVGVEGQPAGHNPRFS
jgi:hypothetical protein